MVFQAVCSYCVKNNHRTPPFPWVVKETLVILQQYPAGVTRSLILTEVEHRWRDAVKRGEHSGKLWSVLTNMQLEPSDVLAGMLHGDGFRGRLSSSAGTEKAVASNSNGNGNGNGGDGTSSIDLIMHRQYSEFLAFCASHQFDIAKSSRPIVS